MLLIDLFTWWYTSGLLGFFGTLKNLLRSTLRTFSFGSLLKNLFAPYRQIAAGEQGRDLRSRFSVFIDKTFSRLIGFVVRIFLIIFGLIILILELPLLLFLALLWPLVPLMPVVCLILTINGVTL